MPGTRSTRSSSHTEASQPAPSEDRARTAAQTQVLHDTKTVPRATKGRGAKRKTADAPPLPQQRSHGASVVADSLLSQNGEARSTRSGTATKAPCKKHDAPARTASAQIRIREPRQDQQKVNTPGSGEQANHEGLTAQLSAAKATQPHASSGATHGQKAVSQQNAKRRKADSTSGAKAPAEQQSASKTGTKNPIETVMQSDPDDQQQDVQNKRHRTAGSPKKGRAKQARASSQKANTKGVSSADATASAQADAQHDTQSEAGAPPAAKCSKQGAGKRSKPAAVKQSTALPKKAPDKSQKGKAGIVTRQAAKSKPAETDASSAQHARQQNNSKQAETAPAPGQAQLAPADPHNASQPASSSALPLSGVTQETKALASKVLQQTLGIGLSARAVSFPKPSDKLWLAGSAGNCCWTLLQTHVIVCIRCTSLVDLVSLMVRLSCM